MTHLTTRWVKQTQRANFFPITGNRSVTETHIISAFHL